jgi:copper chaperone CopZ
MRQLLGIALLLLSCPFAAFAEESTVLEIDVRGMVCAFCVEGLRSNLLELPGVKDVRVSLKRSLARIEIGEGRALDLDELKQTIIDAGFTPGDVREGP